MASLYVNGGQGTPSDDCFQRCLGNHDADNSGSFFPPPPPLPPPQPCRNVPLDLATLVNTVGYQHTGFGYPVANGCNGCSGPNGYSIAMRGVEPVRVHVELGSSSRNADNTYSSRTTTGWSLSSVILSTFLTAAVTVTIISLRRSFSLRRLLEEVLKVVGWMEAKPMPVDKVPEPAQTPMISCTCRNRAESIVPARRLERKRSLSRSSAAQNGYSPAVDAIDVPLPPSSSVRPVAPAPLETKKAESPISHEEVAAMVGHIIPELNLEAFFAEKSDFVSHIVEQAASLKDDPNTSFGDSRESIDRLIRLSLYQPVIYCDDSGSMKERRYDAQQELVVHIADIATKIVPEDYGVELRFINDRTLSNLQAVQVEAVMKRVKVRDTNLTNLGQGLRQKILKPLVYDILDKGKRLERPLLVCVITDGHPYPENTNTFKDAIVECRRRLVEAGYIPTAVMFLISQIGSELYCTTERLDEELARLKENERKLDEWLLRTLTTPIMMEITHELPALPPVQPQMRPTSQPSVATLVGETEGSVGQRRASAEALTEDFEVLRQPQD
ncbi:hypothetical protein NM688_g4591 [Phlebia brevispora]|uniref:Uncharacterized protein n=1 Tax=Phlebia brevispora TaxID=194682 RepID=A0ACC1T277_9APHY|nr:hypothetical protein NM688_g4591 [Phlebia brevispora]